MSANLITSLEVQIIVRGLMLYHEGQDFTLYQGDNLDVLPTLADNSVDAIVTDPPYELGFMGKSWDASGIAFNPAMWREAMRVLKPGGHLLAFSGSRTYHRIAVAIEDAGFEIRDQIMWIYGSGFPKSMNLSKAIEATLTTGNANKTQFSKLNGKKTPRRDANGLMHGNEFHDNRPNDYTKTAEGDFLSELEPTTDEAKQWQGWGTALKPAHEPIVVARKPVIGTVAANVLTYGTGGLNIDGGRVEGLSDKEKNWTPQRQNTKPDIYVGGAQIGDEQPMYNNKGRWPANVIHDGLEDEWARFFYCAKTSKRDRNEGLDDFDEVRIHDGRAEGGVGGSNPRNRTNNYRQNHHPTVKPTDLMRYLCRLVTPKGGIVLDPFTGSGSTGKAAIYEGFKFIGIEMTEEYLPIAKARIEFAVNEVSSHLL